MSLHPGCYSPLRSPPIHQGPADAADVAIAVGGHRYTRLHTAPPKECWAVDKVDTALVSQMALSLALVTPTRDLLLRSFYRPHRTLSVRKFLLWDKQSH